MKKIILTAVCIATTMVINAQKVALHSGGNVSIFNGTSALVNAYNASQAGDTIYLPGGGFTAPGSVNKKLTIYGAGHYADSTQVTGKTFWNGNLNFGADDDGCDFCEGLGKDYAGNDCYFCNGKGKIGLTPCKKCNGEKRILGKQKISGIKLTGDETKLEAMGHFAKNEPGKVGYLLLIKK